MNSRILIVDDSTTVRRMVNMTLTSAGYEVWEASNGAEAIESLEHQIPDLVITDVNMPEMDGLTFVRTARGNPRIPKIPILVLTTVNDPSFKEQGRLAGATGWLCKPFQPTKLCDAVRVVLARRTS
ncbi:MAG: response regulator [Planctomycetes bacterium]|nr:response regulator [Planctomycetota bacterium]